MDVFVYSEMYIAGIGSLILLGVKIMHFINRTDLFEISNLFWVERRL
jgi:hypothetical protein